MSQKTKNRSQVNGDQLRDALRADLECAAASINVILQTPELMDLFYATMENHRQEYIKKTAKAQKDGVPSPN